MSRIEEALRKAKASRYSDDDTATANVHRLMESARGQQKGDRPLAPAASQIPSNHVVQFDNDLLQQERVIAASKDDERVGSYRQLRTQILTTMRQNNWSTLAITSAHEGAGKSLTAVNLSISLAKSANTNVLLVDLDLNSPSVHKKLNLHPEKGLVDYLEGRATVEEILFDPGIDQLIVMVGRSAGGHSSELLASPRMNELMRDLCQQDETNITVFDLPPLLRNDDAILFAPLADATLIVVEDGVTTVEQLGRALQLLDKANVIGTLLNKAQI